MDQRTCLQCGKRFCPPPVSGYRNSKLCSTACRNASFRRRVPFTCQWCGKVKEVRPSLAAKRRYCGKACGRAANRRSEESRFWAFVSKADGCWTWGGATNRKGYGRFTVGGKLRLAHRLVWAWTRGPIPDGVRVLHHCDNPACVNPKHLFLGTDQDNTNDMVAKGRARWQRS